MSGALAGQLQTPETQEAPVAQTVGHAPQWLTSFDRLAQTVPQLTVPVGQMQVPDPHVAPAGQTVPQAPQLPGSV
jgi:hypothetical protein